MTTLPKIKGKRISRHFPYTWNADLIAFDGPLLSLYKGNENEEDALLSWLDCDEEINRWCIVPVKKPDFLDYLSRKKSLLELYKRTNYVTVFDIKNFNRSNFIETKWRDLPENYLPHEDSYLDDLISTEAAKKLSANIPTNYKINLDGELYLDDLAGIPKLYLQLYSFHYGIEYLAHESVRYVFNSKISKWRGGFSVVNLFNGLKSAMPSIHRPRLFGMQYNSPGSITLDVLPDIALEIEESIHNISDERKFKEAEELYNSVYNFFSREKIRGFEREESADIGIVTNDQLDAINGFIDRFFVMMNWHDRQERFRSLEISPISQLKSLLAYYRRLRNLRKYVISGKVRF